MSAEQRLLDLNVELPNELPPVGMYVPAVRSGSLIFLGGHGPVRHDGTLVVGQVGADLDIATGADAAYLTGLNLLATLKRELTTLDHVARVVKLFGMVNAVDGFTRHPEIVDGCSRLIREIFGTAGNHARSSVGVASLPFNIPIEIELVAEVHGDASSVS